MEPKILWNCLRDLKYYTNQNIFTIFYSTSKKYGFENPTLKMIGSIRPMETIQTKSLLDLQ